MLRVRDAAGSARDFYQLGRYYQGQNRFAQAADAYRKALEYHKDDIEARNALATTYSAQGKLDEAIAEFEAILKVKPELAHLHNNLGYAYYLQGNVGNAVAAFETAMALEPGNPRTYNNLGLAYRKMGDSEKSRLAFARAAALNNTGAGAVAATGAAGNVASAAPSIALKNDAPSIDLPPQSASLPLTVGNDGVALAAATSVDYTSSAHLASAADSRLDRAQLDGELDGNPWPDRGSRHRHRLPAAHLDLAMRSGCRSPTATVSPAWQKKSARGWPSKACRSRI